MWRLALVLAVGCGRVSFDGRVDAAAADVAIDAPYPTGAFTAITRVTELGVDMVLDDDPNPTENLLEIFFTSSRVGGTGGCDIYTATRASPTDVWGTPASITAIVSTSCDSGPRISRDGLQMYFASTRGMTFSDVYFTTRDAVGAAWQTPITVTELNTPADADGSLSVSADGLVAIMFSTRDAGDELYEVRRATPASAWGTPVRLIGLNSSSRDRSPNLSPDGLRLVFASDRPGGLGMGDIYMTTRPTVDDPWAAPTRMSDISTALNEDDPWLSADGHTMMWTSDGPSGDSELFTASR